MKFLVIGDSCIDVFSYGKVNRLAPEAPVPIIIPEKETSNPGMAGNVVKLI
jgi:bifunctional ADP-heptose synthase (sugar kinase/adenylyltransferase)